MQSNQLKFNCYYVYFCSVSKNTHIIFYLTLARRKLSWKWTNK